MSKLVVVGSQINIFRNRLRPRSEGNNTNVAKIVAKTRGIFTHRKLCHESVAISKSVEKEQEKLKPPAIRDTKKTTLFCKT